MEEKEEISIMTFDMKLADRVIRIHAIHDYIKEYCRDYVLSKQGESSEESPVDFEVISAPRLQSLSQIAS